MKRIIIALAMHGVFTLCMTSPTAKVIQLKT